MCFISKDKVSSLLVRLDCVLRSSNTKKRKKCNEVRPMCSRCSERNLGCVYEAAIPATDGEASSFAETAVGQEQPWVNQGFLQPGAGPENITNAQYLRKGKGYQQTTNDADLSPWASNRLLQLEYLRTGTSHALPWDTSLHSAESSFLCRCVVCTRHQYGWSLDASGVASACYGGFTQAAANYDKCQWAAFDTCDYSRYPVEPIAKHRGWS